MCFQRKCVSREQVHQQIVYRDEVLQQMFFQRIGTPANVFLENRCESAIVFLENRYTSKYFYREQAHQQIVSTKEACQQIVSTEQLHQQICFQRIGTLANAFLENRCTNKCVSEAFLFLVIFNVTPSLSCVHIRSLSSDLERRL